MKVYAFVGTSPVIDVDDLTWKTIELAFTGGQVMAAEAEHGLTAQIQGDSVVGIGDLSGSGDSFPSGLAMTVTFTASTNMSDVVIDFSTSTTAITMDDPATYPTVEWSMLPNSLVACIVQDSHNKIYAFAPGTDITSINIANPTDSLEITSLVSGLTSQLGTGFFGLARLDGTGNPIEQQTPIAIANEELAPNAVGSQTSIVKSPVSPGYDYVIFVIGAVFSDPCKRCGYPYEEGTTAYRGDCKANAANDACASELDGSSCYLAAPSCTCDSVDLNPAFDAFLATCAENSGTCRASGLQCYSGSDLCQPVVESCFDGPLPPSQPPSPPPASPPPPSPPPP